jgi:hypothetical protein
VISAFDQSLLPQLFPDRRPPILASEKFFRVFPGLFPRDEFVARGNVKGDAIVEVGFQMQLRRSTELSVMSGRLARSSLIRHKVTTSFGVIRPWFRVNWSTACSSSLLVYDLREPPQMRYP